MKSNHVFAFRQKNTSTKCHNETHFYFFTLIKYEIFLLKLIQKLFNYFENTMFVFHYNHYINAYKNHVYL